MDKKIFHFRPAELRKNADRWQILYYVESPTDPGVFLRKRETFELNRIKSEKEREKVAFRWIRRLNDNLLPNGYPFVSIKKIESPIMPLHKAWDFAVKIKQVSDKIETVRTYRGIDSIFCQFLEFENLSDLPVSLFSKKHVTAFSDYITVHRKNAARTHNNYIGFLHAAWEELVRREIVENNIWSKAKRLKAAPTTRRAFLPHERKLVAEEIQKNDQMLFLWIAFEYYLFIRGEELRRLRMHMVNLRKGFIHLPANCTKNGKARNVTIPKILEPYLFPFLKKENLLLFGAKMQAHPSKPVGKNTPNSRHRKILLQLQKKGTLKNIEGLSVYSWKYTGISDDVNNAFVSITDVQGQADHADTAQTIKYLRKSTTNPRIRDSKKDIFAAPK